MKSEKSDKEAVEHKKKNIPIFAANYKYIFT